LTKWHFFLYIKGPSKRPDKLDANAVYNIIGKINEKVNLKGCAEAPFVKIRCPDEALNIICSSLERFDVNKKKLTNDQACFSVYTAFVCGVDTPESMKRFLKYDQELHGLAQWLTTGTGYFRIYSLQFVSS